MTSGFSTGRRVSPGWPFCPPDFLPDGSRKLWTRRTRAGFFKPSLDGGLLLLLLFNPSRRSNSDTRAFDVAFSSLQRADFLLQALFSSFGATFSVSDASNRSLNVTARGSDAASRLLSLATFPSEAASRFSSAAFSANCCRSWPLSLSRLLVGRCIPPLSQIHACGNRPLVRTESIRRTQDQE